MTALAHNPTLLHSLTTIHPTGYSEPPTVKLVDGSVVMTWLDGQVEFTVALGGHAKPVEYLRQTAARCLLVAAELEANQ